MTTLSVARDFSKYPGGRFIKISENSGEEFRDRLLLPALRTNGRVEVELDGVVGYGSSFLEEVFGGIIRAMKWRTRTEFNQHVAFTSERDSWVREVNQYIDEELSRQV